MTRPPNREIVTGRVFGRHANRFRVKVGEIEYLCELRGNLRKARENRTSPVAVGDEVEIIPGAGGDATIHAVLPRRSRLSRPDVGRAEREQIIVSNVDQAITVTSIVDPRVESTTLDRCLLLAETNDLPVLLCINKTDLSPREEVERLASRYAALGYQILLTSAVRSEGIDRMRELMQGRTSVLFGPSGVGKSTLLNAIEPGLGKKVGDLSERRGSGKHTTTAIELHPVGRDGFVADTPGQDAFELWRIPRGVLRDYFPEFAEFQARCRFTDCRHDAEPGCAVRAAAADGRITPERFSSYLSILTSLDS
ncbi:MAG: ribosome small subunit-dependent GTPase A [Planctomycetes bacterium]|nr:ribosome small subunit-dependent GTPase A [Planctomycetota bacterium]